MEDFALLSRLYLPQNLSDCLTLGIYLKLLYNFIIIT